MQLARRLGIAEEQLVHIRRGALLHDIGKMGIPDNILLKPGPLTAEEWDIMRKHPVYALDLLSPIDFLAPALDIPYCHHEKWDGSGYPHGPARRARSPWRRASSPWSTCGTRSPRTGPTARPGRPTGAGYIREQAGKHFDPHIVEHFLAILAEEELRRRTNPPSPSRRRGKARRQESAGGGRPAG